MEPRARLLVILFLGVLTIPLILMLGGLWIYDPLQLFHPPWGRAETVNANLRLQAAGVIRHRQFNAAIIGTSVMENMSAADAGSRLPGNFVNLSLTASDFFERARVLDYALSHKHLKTVIYSLDSVYMNTRRGYPIFPYATFEFLYDRNPLNDFRAYFNEHFLTCLAQWSVAPECVGKPVGMDRPNAWLGDAENMRRFGGLEKWCDAKNNYQIQDALGKMRVAAQAIEKGVVESLPEAVAERRVGDALRYVDEYVLDRVKKYPETRFYLVFPPYFRAQPAIWYQYRLVNWRIHAAVIHHLAAAQERLPNMRLFGFENEAFVDDIANYKDLAHYHPDLDATLLASLAAGRGMITLRDVDAYIADAAKKAREFDLPGLIRGLDACGEVARGGGNG